MSAHSTAGPLRVDGGRLEPDVPYLSAVAMSAAATIVDAVDALEQCLLSGFDPETDPPRAAMPTPSGTVLMMPALLGDAAGLKIVSIAPGNEALGRPLVQAMYVLLDAVTLTPVARLDGTYLTTLRTSAVSALAARHLARTGASRLVVFGAGVQAWGHVQGLAQVLALEHVAVVGRSPTRAAQLASRIGRELGIAASVATADAVSTADVVACCTTARTALFPGRLLRAGTLVLAIGAYEPDAREIDDDAVRRGRLVVESRTSAMGEAGDVIGPVEAGIVAVEELTTLREIVCGDVVLPQQSIPIFKGTGMSWQDLAVATMVAEKARPGARSD